MLRPGFFNRGRSRGPQLPVHTFILSVPIQGTDHRLHGFQGFGSGQQTLTGDLRNQLNGERTSKTTFRIVYACNPQNLRFISCKDTA